MLLVSFLLFYFILFFLPYVKREVTRVMSAVETKTQNLGSKTKTKTES